MRLGVSDLWCGIGGEHDDDRRVCRLCSGGVEDELHVMVRCPAYGDEQKKLYDDIRGSGV